MAPPHSKTPSSVCSMGPACSPNQMRNLAATSNLLRPWIVLCGRTRIYLPITRWQFRKRSSSRDEMSKPQLLKLWHLGKVGGPHLFVFFLSCQSLTLQKQYDK